MTGRSRPRLARNARGSVAVMAAAALPVLIGAAALAVDVGHAALDRRALQGIADAAALAAAGDPPHAQERAERAVAVSGWRRPVQLAVATGSYRRDRTVAPADRLAIGAAPADAARVTLTSTTPSFFGRIFGHEAMPLTRSAGAARVRLAGLAIGSRMASLDGGLLNRYLSALTGSSISLDLLDYRALAAVDIDLFRYLSAVRTEARLTADSYQEIAAASVSAGEALSAAAALVSRDDPAAGAVLRLLADRAGSGRLSLATLIDPGPLGAQGSGGTGIARVDALGLVTAVLQRSSTTRRVTLDLGADVPGLATTRLTVAFGEPMAASPWIAIGDAGSATVRTAQARIALETRLAPAALPAIGTPVAVTLPLFVELAGAEARLDQIDCATRDMRGVSVSARPGPGQAALGTVPLDRLANFSTSLPIAPARLIDTALIDVDARAAVALGAAEPWQSLRFDAAALSTGAVRTVSSHAISQSLAASLTRDARFTVSVIGLPIAVTPLTQAIGQQLAVAAPAVDALLGATLGMLGIGYGEADVRVTGLRCGTAALVE